MPRFAVAYHESIAIERLHEYFDGPQANLIVITAGTTCEKCGLMFAVVLTAKTDPRNHEYITHLDYVINDDCRNGQHQQEYALEHPH
jgi:hypothetical protein